MSLNCANNEGGGKQEAISENAERFLCNFASEKCQMTRDERNEDDFVGNDDDNDDDISKDRK